MKFQEYCCRQYNVIYLTKNIYMQDSSIVFCPQMEKLQKSLHITDITNHKSLQWKIINFNSDRDVGICCFINTEDNANKSNSWITGNLVWFTCNDPSHICLYKNIVRSSTRAPPFWILLAYVMSIKDIQIMFSKLQHVCYSPMDKVPHLNTGIWIYFLNGS